MRNKLFLRRAGNRGEGGERGGRLVYCTQYNSRPVSFVLRLSTVAYCFQIFTLFFCGVQSTTLRFPSVVKLVNCIFSNSLAYFLREIVVQWK